MPARGIAGAQTAPEREAQRAAEVLRGCVKDSGVAIREVERRANWGQGTLNAVLSGGVSLRIDHVAAVCEAIGLPLRDFYKMLAGGEEAAPIGAGGPITKRELVAMRQMCAKNTNELAEHANELAELRRLVKEMQERERQSGV